MRVVALNSNYPDRYNNWAPWNRAANLALARAGLDVEVVAPRPYAFDLPAFPHRELARLPVSLVAEEGRVHYPRFFYAWPKRLFYGIAGESYQRRVTSYCQKNVARADVVHAHHAYPDGYGGLRLRKEWRAPLVVDIHGDDTLQMHVHDASSGRKWAKAIDEADALICVSQRLARLAMDRGIDASKIHYVPLGVDIDAFRPRDRAKLKEALGCGPQLLFLYVGQLIERKGVDVLLRAFASLEPNERERATLAIAGAGPEAERLHALARNLGIGGAVRFLGRVSADDLRLWYAACDAFTLPSRSEGRPTVVNEAMASGAAVIASRISGVPEQVETGSTGWLVPVGDVGALRDAIRNAIADPEKLATMGRAGRARVLTEDWTWAAYARRLTTIYERLVGGVESQG